MYTGGVELSRNLPLCGRIRVWAIRPFRTIGRVGLSERDFASRSEIIVNMGKVSAKNCVPFGAETMEYDPYTVETTRNYNAGTGTRQNTSVQAKERNRQAFQRRMAQQKSRIHGAEPKT